MPSSPLDHSDWLRFLEATAGREPDAGSLSALEWAIASSPSGQRRALDLGCGSGNEALAFLRAGFSVVAVDALPEAVGCVERRAREAGLADGLTGVCRPLADVVIEPGRYALIHARFTLPFVAATDFPTLWTKIRTGLAPGGVFAGQLFGPRDQFVGEHPPGSMSIHDGPAVRELLTGLEILRLEEIEKHGHTALGRPKYWHAHHVAARRAEG